MCVDYNTYLGKGDATLSRCIPWAKIIYITTHLVNGFLNILNCCKNGPMNHLSHPKLYSRQKTLLALLQKFGGKLSSIDLQKYLFLFTETCEKDRSYEFVPYRFGCFSFQSYADRRKFVEFGILDEGDKWSLLSADVDYVSMLSVNSPVFSRHPSNAKR